MKQYYVLFKNHDNGMRLYNSLKSKNIKATIAPTPRVASKSCGISLLINKDDIETITGHFKSIRNLARANKLQLNTTDCIVCVIYGEKDELNDHYKKIDEFTLNIGE